MDSCDEYLPSVADRTAEALSAWAPLHAWSRSEMAREARLPAWFGRAV